MLIDPRVWLLILVVTVVEASVGLVKFYIGRQGMVAVQKRFPKIKPERWQRIDQWFKRWGYDLFGFFGVIYRPVLMVLLITTIDVYQHYYADTGTDAITVEVPSNPPQLAPKAQE